MTDAEYIALTAGLKALTGIDLHCYKTQQTRRRLDGYIAAAGMPFADFLAVIRADSAALARLADFLTINVTEFFRDPAYFQALKMDILPQLVERAPSLNIWSAGCSSGAEPYSLAITLSEMTQGRAHRILATDLDQEALDQAQTGGPYSAAETRNLTRWMQLKYFEATPSGLAAKDSLKRMVQFQRHNLLTDPFEGNFDLILCRNVVIYLSEGTKNALNQRLVRSLRNGGWLFIGGAETLTHFHELGLERLHTCMYQKSTAMAGAHTPAVTAV